MLHLISFLHIITKAERTALLCRRKLATVPLDWLLSASLELEKVEGSFITLVNSPPCKSRSKDARKSNKAQCWILFYFTLKASPIVMESLRSTETKEEGEKSCLKISTENRQMIVEKASRLLGCRRFPLRTISSSPKRNNRQTEITVVRGGGTFIIE